MKKINNDAIEQNADDLPSGAITTRKRSKARVVAESICGLLALSYFLFYWENNSIDVSRYEIESARAPRSLDGLTIVQVSDLHRKSFGKENARLLELIRKEAPDVIAVTGDLIDERIPDLDYAQKTIEQLVKIAPTFYVTGNHEGAFVDYFRESVLDAIARGGAIMLDNEQVELTRGKDGKIEIAPFARGTDRKPSPDSALLAGICDPNTTYTSKLRRVVQYRLSGVIVEDLIAAVPRADEQFSILLTHRPECFEQYAAHKFDLVFAGHAHGGQFRCPWFLTNGLYAPDQGFFPKYTSGRYDLNGTTEIVSRGLGPSVVPTRIFNRPNLVVCKLRAKTR